MAPQERLDVDSDIRELRKANTDIIKELGVLVAASSKMEVAMTQMSDAVEILARSQIKLEFHDEQINTILSVQKEHDVSIKNLETSIYQACDAKKDELKNAEEKLHTRINEQSDEVDGKITTKFIWAVAVTLCCFGYIVIDDRSSNEKMDTILKTVVKTDKQVSLNSLEIAHIKKELDEETNHEHGGR